VEPLLHASSCLASIDATVIIPTDTSKIYRLHTFLILYKRIFRIHGAYFASSQKHKINTVLRGFMTLLSSETFYLCVSMCQREDKNGVIHKSAMNVAEVELSFKRIFYI